LPLLHSLVPTLVVTTRIFLYSASSFVVTLSDFAVTIFALGPATRRCYLVPLRRFRIRPSILLRFLHPLLRILYARFVSEAPLYSSKTFDALPFSSAFPTTSTVAPCPCIYEEEDPKTTESTPISPTYQGLAQGLRYLGELHLEPTAVCFFGPFLPRFVKSPFRALLPRLLRSLWSVLVLFFGRVRQRLPTIRRAKLLLLPRGSVSALLVPRLRRFLRALRLPYPVPLRLHLHFIFLRL
jgi:hypothetical protein